MRRLLHAPFLAASFCALILPTALLAQNDGPPETVTVKISLEGAPVSGLSLRVVGEPPGGGEITFGEGETDEGGLYQVDVPFRPGLMLRADTTFEGVKYQSPKLPFAGSPGAGLTLEVEVFSSDTAKFEDLALSTDSHLLIEIQEGFLDITEVLFVQNSSRGAFAPEGGLILPLPAGHRDVQGVGGKPVSAVKHVGASIPGPFLPGQTEVQVRYELPFDQADLVFEQPITLPWPSSRVIIDEVPGLVFSGAQVEGQELREASGRQLRLVSIHPEGGKIAFSISGLPVRTHNGRWVALGLAILLAALGFIGGLLPTRETEGPSETLLALSAEKTALLTELEELELEHAQGELGDETFSEDRTAAIDQLAAVLRALASADGSDGPDGDGPGARG